MSKERNMHDPVCDLLAIRRAMLCAMFHNFRIFHSRVETM